jgi:general secretion pathway protein E
VRLLCPSCKVPYKPTQYELSQLGLDSARLDWKATRNISPRYTVHGHTHEFIGEGMRDPIFYKAGGCDACMKKGFVGRRGIYELLIVDDAVGPLILRNADAQTVKRTAVAQGMETMRDDGARKVLLGLTTVEEVLAATQEDIMLEESPVSRSPGQASLPPASRRGVVG